MNATIYHDSTHLGESDLIDFGDRCPICCSTAPRRGVFQIQDNPRIELLECSSCRGCSASHMPRPEVLSRLYTNYYARSEQKATHSNVNRLANRIVAALDRQPRMQTARIIDFGGGDGSLGLEIASQLLRRGQADEAEVIVVDFHDIAPSSDARVKMRVVADLAQVDSPADIVLASAVMEHLPQSNSIFRQLFGLVKPGGYYYARTPWSLPMTRVLKNLDITYPFHVHDMGGGFWNRVLETFGINGRIVFSRTSPVETSIVTHPARTVTATLLKVPSRIETALRQPQNTDPFWSLVGGWEILLQLDGDT